MSQKYKLTTDNEDDSVWASIKRHLRLALLLVVTPIAAVIVLSVISITAEIRQRVVNENNRAAIAMTRAAQPTRTPRPTPGPPTVDRDTPLRSGPAMRFDAIGTIEKGEPIVVVGQNDAGNWFMLDNGFWVAAIAVINEPSDLPIYP